MQSESIHSLLIPIIEETYGKLVSILKKTSANYSNWTTVLGREFTQVPNDIRDEYEEYQFVSA